MEGEKRCCDSDLEGGRETHVLQRQTESGRAKSHISAKKKKWLKKLFQTFFFFIVVFCVVLLRSRGSGGSQTSARAETFLPLELKTFFNQKRKNCALFSFCIELHTEKYKQNTSHLKVFSTFQGWLHCPKQNLLYLSPLRHQYGVPRNSK